MVALTAYDTIALRIPSPCASHFSPCFAIQSGSCISTGFCFGGGGGDSLSTSELRARTGADVRCVGVAASLLLLLLLLLVSTPLRTEDALASDVLVTFAFD